MPAKHIKARYWIATGIFDALPSFTDLEHRIDTIAEEKDRGDVFEIFVEGFLATQPIMQCVTHWVVGDIPLTLRQRYNLPGDAKGIDGVYESRLGGHVAYQVKYRQKGYLTYTEVAPFLGITERFTERIIFTTASELADDALNRGGMRLVRGDDFRALEPADLARIVAWLKEKPLPRSPFTPKPYQTDALTAIRTALNTQDRATVVMACGTGKTLVSLWATQDAQPKTVLVLVPSLTLLQQTLGEWSKHHTFAPGFRYLCVCSDQTVDLANDELEVRPSDVEFRIDTEPEVVTRFLAHPTDDVKIIFSTYHSSSVVGAGATGYTFDLGIFDEAHKTTGREGGAFSYALSDERLSIKKRLFFTATPRHYDIRHRDKEGEFRVQSMDDPQVYGTRAHTLSFASAAKQGIICPYKVVISLIDKDMVSDFARKHGITLIETDLMRARWVAHLLAFQQAVESTGATKVLTFHSRVKAAEEFASDTLHGIGRYLNGYDVRHVHGKQRSSERKALIEAFRHGEKGVLTNARCLTEGVDVPAVDMVAFLDPKQSRIDIAQATGRAMRKPQGASTKTVGYIVVPLFAANFTQESLEEAIESEGFDQVADVLNALQEHDEDLIDIIRDLREQKGAGEPFDLGRLQEKVEVIGPSVDLVRLNTSISVAVVDQIGSSWDEWYGRLKAFKQHERHCQVPRHYSEEGYRLGQWVHNQRQEKDSMLPERRERLDALGFVWDPFEVQWEEGFGFLQKFRHREGHCRVPTDYLQADYPLGQWVRRQRRDRDTMPQERRRRLDTLGFVWDPMEAQWEEGVGFLLEFHQREGHCRVPVTHCEKGYRLGRWVNKQRQGRDTMAPQRRQRLDALGFVWDPFEAQWEEGFDFLQKFYQREGHCQVSREDHEGEYPLGQWVKVQRRGRDTMPQERRRRLDALGFVWDPHDVQWEKGFRFLQNFHQREGHCRVPWGYCDGDYPLGQWVFVQRQGKDTMSRERLRRLDALGFVWDPHDTQWEEGFGFLQKFHQRKGHCRVPATHCEKGYRLGRWVVKQRQGRDTMAPQRRQRLDALGFVWKVRS
jgi:superfamily II DNA or RNA helicase